MSEPKFTKGEWSLFNGKDVGVIDTSDTQSYGMVNVVVYIELYDFPKEEVNANAHLIAAAPEIYSMLVQLQTEGGLGIARHRQIDRLLAKARGEHNA